MATAVDDILARARVRAALPPPAARQALRTRFGLTLEDVATAVGVNPSTVSRWEQGVRTPRASLVPSYVELLERLAALDDEDLGCHPEVLVETSTGRTGAHRVPA